MLSFGSYLLCMASGFYFRCLFIMRSSHSMTLFRHLTLLALFIYLIVVPLKHHLLIFSSKLTVLNLFVNSIDVL